MKLSTQGERDKVWRPIAAFAILLAIYQLAEALQTWAAPRSPVGPALMVAALLIAWPLGRWLGWGGYDAYALDLRPASFGLLAAGVALAILAKFAALAVGLGLGTYTFSHDLPAPPAPAMLATGLLVTFIPSLAEDILTRGFPLRSFGIRWSGWAFVLASAALYTLNHLWRLDWGWTEQFRLFCLGLAYAAAAWRWRTLWGAVALHWGWNFSSILADPLFPVDIASTDGPRLVSAGVHLILLAIVLLLPGSAKEAR